ncbi:RHS repeat domain-containing protein [Paenibacillus wenxiniae]|uniref:RHS repeat domain-containing protein n=1 Tax=Paenibacillus wenxiniae TaxID=1636843 RepID=A0ABW4RKH7_9BACL
MLRWITRKVMIVLLCVAFTMIGRAVYAADYTYDSLNRVISAEHENGVTTYKYDAGGNLLSITSTHTPAVQKSNVIQDWTAYITPGIKARYETATADVYASSVTDDVYTNATPTVTSNVYANSGTTTTVTSDVYTPPTDSLVAQWMTLDARKAGGASIYRDIPVQSNTSYTYKGWVTSDQLQNAVVQVVINYYNSQNRLIRYDHVLDLQQNTTWAPYAASLITPAGAVKARVHLQVVLLKPNAHAHAGFADRTFKQAEATS